MVETMGLWVAAVMFNIVGHSPAKDNTIYLICRILGLVYGVALLFTLNSVGIVLGVIFVFFKLYLMLYRHAGVQLI